MKFFSYLALLIVLPFLLPYQNPSDPSAAPDVEVRKFSWNKHRAPSLMSNENQGDYTTTEVRTDLELSRQERANRNSIENQSRDLRRVEVDARNDSRQGAPIDLYRYVVSLRNRGAKVITSIVWDYQFSEPADPDNPSHRQFRCSVKLKPDDNKSLEAFSTRPPLRVVSANSSGKTLVEKVVINQVEFADGTNWQRADWTAPPPSETKNRWRSSCQPLL